MKIYFLFLALFLLNSTEVFAATQEYRPRQLKAGSTFQVRLSAELIKNREQQWMETDGQFGKRCGFHIMSRFDQALAEQTPNAEYVLVSGGIQGQSLVSYYHGMIEDQFSITMTTENKSLPLLQFGCMVRSPISKGPTKWTVSSVEEFISQPGFFKHIQPSQETFITAFELVSSPLAVRTLVPLRFVAVQSGPNSISHVETPGFQNGKVVKSFEPGPRCSASYSERVALDLKPYDVTIPAGVDFEILYVTYPLSGPRLYFKDSKNQIELSISCFFGDRELKSFSQIEEQLSGIFEFRK